MRFEVLEPPRTQHHPKLMLENWTHLDILAMMWFEKVSMRFEVLEPPRTQPELVLKHPLQLTSPGREGSV